MLIDTDYLVVGAGASGLAFADALVAEADVDVTLIDRRRAPGGHWLNAYPFVRLDTPSAYYGVNSLSLGGDRIDQSGEKRWVLRAGDRPGGVRVLRRCGRAAYADRASSPAHWS
ncbi:MAG: NAD(P)-binding protein [Solirubrobacteraceae bacterium]